MEYKASLDKYAKIITVGTSIFLLVIVYLGFRVSPRPYKETDNTIFHTFMILLPFLILLVSYLLSPRSYILDGNELKIVNHGGNRKIRLPEIVEVRNLDDAEIKSAKRIFASSGLFGYFGKFYIKSTGNISFYATQRKNGLLIITQDGKHVLITPDDISLAETLRGRIPENYYTKT